MNSITVSFNLVNKMFFSLEVCDNNDLVTFVTFEV
jgi:hypothetical protein